VTEETVRATPDSFEYKNRLRGVVCALWTGPNRWAVMGPISEAPPAPAYSTDVLLPNDIRTYVICEPTELMRRRDEELRKIVDIFGSSP